jgi:hypothetical protein
MTYRIHPFSISFQRPFPHSSREHPTPSMLHPSPHDPRTGAPQTNRNLRPSSSSSFLPSGRPKDNSLSRVSHRQSSSASSYPSGHSIAYGPQDPRSYPMAVPDPYSRGPHQSHAPHNPPFSPPISHVSQGPRYPEAEPPFESYWQSGPATFHPSKTYSRPPTGTPLNAEVADVGTRPNKTLDHQPSNPVASGGPSTEETAEGIFSTEYRHECSHCGKRFNRPSGLRVGLHFHISPSICFEPEDLFRFILLHTQETNVREAVCCLSVCTDGDGY